MDTTARRFSIMPPTPLPTQPFSYVAGDATSYVRLRLDKTAPRHDEQGAPGAGEGIQGRDHLACEAIMYEQYVILYYIDWTHLSGIQQLCTHPLEI